MIHFLNPEDFPAVKEFATAPMILNCPACGVRHIDEGEFADKPHHTHACQGCGLVWRPAKINTHGVEFLPGYKNLEPEKPIACATGRCGSCPTCQARA